MHVSKDFKDIVLPPDATDHEVIEILKLCATFSVDINCKNPDIVDWIFKHKAWIKKGGE